MKVIFRITKFVLLCLAIYLPVQTAQAFVVKAIRIDGLQGISRETVLNYLPVQVGENFDPAKSSQVIRTLYGTGFFSDVELGQDGSTLVVKVVERPVIASVNVTGNKEIPKDKLDEVLKSFGLVQGQVFDTSMLDKIKHGLEQQYDSVGKYNARVDTEVTPQPRNRVAIQITISEGRTVQVSDIKIIGNHAFSNSELVSQFKLTTPHLWSFISRGDQYSQQKLDESLQALQSFYMDRGYLRFKIDSTQVSLTPDRKYVYIVVHITEGPVYKVKGYKLSGDLVVPQQKLQRLIPIKAGDVFSRKAVQEASNNIGRLLGNMGYAFANVNTIPDVDEQTKQIFLTFYVDPGRRVYVRRINFTGNTKTEDNVLRHAMRQNEGGLIAVDDVKESERQLNLLGYLQNVHVQTKQVEDTPDQVDLDFNVTEAPSAQATAGVGYGTDGFVVNAGVNQNNFLGTGKTLGVNFNNSLYQTLYSVNYNNPYYTEDGIQRGFSLYASRLTPGNLNIARFTTDSYGGTVNYSIPMSAKGDSLQLGYGYQDTILQMGSSPSDQVLNFVDSNGRHFNQGLLTAGWTRNGLDRANFPTRGLMQSAGAQISGGVGNTAADYYKASYDFNYYHPLISDSGFIVAVRGSLGYGNGFGATRYLPFFANYYAGGIGFDGQVRGYEANSLGPRDSNDEALGGNELASGTLNLIFPNPISPDKLRTSIFLDGGNVYTTLPESLGGSGAGPLRYSAGFAADWRVPVLNVMLDLSVAKALNPQPHDQTQFFQFNVGTSF